MTRDAIEARLDLLIDELAPLGTSEAASVASILLATKAALAEGNHRELSQQIWMIRDHLHKRPGQTEVVNHAG